MRHWQGPRSGDKLTLSSARHTQARGVPSLATSRLDSDRNRIGCVDPIDLGRLE